MALELGCVSSSNRIEYLRLKYKKRWVWKDVRDTILKEELSVQRPIFRAVYYEPQDECSIAEGSYVPDIEDDQGLQVQALNGEYPTFATPTLSTMEDLAR